MLQLQNISKQYGSKILFKNASAFIGPKSRIAFIGPNGAGKSTMIRMILGQEEPDSGQVVRTSRLAIGHLAQEMPKLSHRSVLEETMRLDGRREEILLNKAEYERKFESSPDTATEEELVLYGRLLEELEHLDEYRLEARAKEILTGMGFKTEDFSRPLSSFSGGWLMRVALSRVLLMDPDLLLLDEPTNHLDLESLLWLEEFLLDYHGAMLLVSHDRAFLNRMVNEVIEVDQKTLTTYRGNLDSYQIQKQERLEILKAQYAGQQSKIAEIESFVDRFGAKATKARQAQSRLKQLEKMELIELPEDRSTVRFHFPPAPHSGKEVVTVKNAKIGYGTKIIFNDLDWIIQRGSRVAVVGVNGAGKTTLLKVLSDTLAPLDGLVIHGHMVKVGYYAQHQAESLDMRKTVFEELLHSSPDLPLSQIRSVAGAFLFSGDAIEKKCSVLSGGEKARVALAKLLLSPSNFLILDEPTNHLDSDSREVLLHALLDYKGTLCLISHDREFMAPLVDKLLEIEPGKNGQTSKVIHLVEGYEDYLARKRRQAAEAAHHIEPEKQKNTVPTNREPTRLSNNQKRSWERERDKLETEITKIEGRFAELTNLLALPETYEDKIKSMSLVEEQRLTEKTMHEKIARWEELCSLLESAN